MIYREVIHHILTWNFHGIGCKKPEPNRVKPNQPNQNRYKPKQNILSNYLVEDFPNPNGSVWFGSVLYLIWNSKIISDLSRNDSPYLNMEWNRV